MKKLILLMLLSYSAITSADFVTGGNISAANNSGGESNKILFNSMHTCQRPSAADPLTQVDPSCEKIVPRSSKSDRAFDELLTMLKGTPEDTSSNEDMSYTYSEFAILMYLAICICGTFSVLFSVFYFKKSK